MAADRSTAAAAGDADAADAVVAEADVHRRVADFLAASGPVGPGRRQLAAFLQAELLAERRGWQRLLASALAEVERLRRTADCAAAGPAELAEDFADDDFGDSDGAVEDEARLWLQPAGTRSLTDLTASQGGFNPRSQRQQQQQQLLADAAAAREEADEARRLGQHQRRLIEELRRTLGRLDARLAQLTDERRRCLDLLRQSRLRGPVAEVEADPEDCSLVQLVSQLIELSAGGEPRKAASPTPVRIPSPPPPTPPPAQPQPQPQPIPICVLQMPPEPAASPQPPQRQQTSVSKPSPRQLRFPYPGEAPLPPIHRRQLVAAASDSAAPRNSDSDGRRRCLRCRRSYQPAENGPTACQFHSLGQLVLTLHPGQRQQQQQQQPQPRLQPQLAWACCGGSPQDPGCCSGRHV